MISKCKTPLNVQFELTYNCNNECRFCYNCNPHLLRTEIDTSIAKTIIKGIYNANVFSVNFNGGEPLCRPDFFELVEYAKKMGFDLHLNTNANLVGDIEAKYISRFFPNICTTILSADETIHDSLSGRKGAFQDTIKGINHLHKNGVYVATNIMICKMNADNIYKTLELLESINVKTILITRLIPASKTSKELHIEDKKFFKIIKLIKNFQEEHHFFDRISFPQPIPPCILPADLVAAVLKWNIACTIGLCTTRISPYGLMTPCTLVDTPIIGDLKHENFLSVWEKFKGVSLCKDKHLRVVCLECDYLSQCGGGCKGYNDVIRHEVNNRARKYESAQI